MIPLGFRLAGLTNILGVLLFSLALTNTRLSELSPTVFSRFGLVAIMLWGAAYLAVATSYRAVPALVAVFAIEKLVYVVTWIEWMSARHGELPQLFGDAPLTATFYAIYGPIDAAFCVFFAMVAWRTRKRASEGGS